MKCVFWDLIDHRITFDFLMGNFTNVFKREMFLNNINCLDVEKLKDNDSAQILIIVVVILKSMQMLLKTLKFFIRPMVIL